MKTMVPELVIAPGLLLRRPPEGAHVLKTDQVAYDRDRSVVTINHGFKAQSHIRTEVWCRQAVCSRQAGHE